MYTAIALYRVVYIHTKPKAYPLRIYILIIYNNYKIIYIKIEKNSLFKATGQERLPLRISTPGFTLRTQDIFQYETLHLLSQ